MSKLMKYFMRGAAVTSALIATVPAALADGKITVDEMAGMAKAVCAAAGWKISLDVPEGIKSNVIGMAFDE